MESVHVFEILLKKVLIRPLVLKIFLANLAVILNTIGGDLCKKLDRNEALHNMEPSLRTELFDKQILCLPNFRWKYSRISISRI